MSEILKELSLAPKKGEKRALLSVRIPQRLLDDVDFVAKQMDLTRTAVVEVMLAAGVVDLKEK